MSLFIKTTKRNCLPTKVIKWYPCNEKAIIPTKRATDVGFDVYALEETVIPAHTVKMIATGLKVVLPDHVWLRAADRGSTGSKGLHVHCGIIDEQYTGEIFIALSNTNDYDIRITDCVDKWEVGLYPITKGIAQLIPEYRLDVISVIATDKEYEAAVAKSERGDGKLGSSGK